MNQIKNKLKIGVSLLAVGLLFSSCLLDDDVTDFGKGPHIVQFESRVSTENFLQTEENPVYTLEVPMVVLGGDGTPLGTDVQVIVSVNTEESTAQSGVEYELPSTTEITIPGGTGVGTFPITVLSGNLDALAPKKVVLQIDSATETVSDFNKTEITLQAICESKIEGSYTYANGVTREATITEVSPGVFSVSGDNAFTSEFAFLITDICGNLTVVGGDIPSNFGIPNSGSGTVDLQSGNITIFYTVDGFFSDREMILIRN